MADQPPGPRLPDRDVTRIRRDQVQSLLDITRRIVGTLDLDELLRTFLDSVIRLFEVDRGLVLLVEESSGELVPRVTRNLKGTRLDQATEVSRRVLAGVRDSKSPILANDAQALGRLREISSIRGKDVRGLVCHPLIAHDRVVGVVYLDSRESVNYFTPTAISLLSTLSNLAAIAIENARRHQAVVERVHDLQGELRRREAFEGIVGASPGVQALLRKVESAAPLPVSILVVGESGTGKELLARAIHARSDRAERKFVAVNCGELPDTLVEGELFGYRKGAFTGAIADRRGLFEEAHQGTLFLDEITNTSTVVQAKLLRALQEGEIKRVGENTPRKVDVRLVCATNADPASLVREGKLREDLYYRINVVVLALPPLRERREDVPLLIEHFLRKYAAKFGKTHRGLTPSAHEAALAYDWPGNVRELENVIQRAMALGRDETLDVADLGIPFVAGAAPAGSHLREQVQAFERALIQRTVEASDGNIARAAEVLGMARQQLHRMVHRYGLAPRPRGAVPDQEPQ